MLHKHRQTNTETTSRIIQNIMVPKIWQYRDCTKRDNRNNKDKTNKQDLTRTPQT